MNSAAGAREFGAAAPVLGGKRGGTMPILGQPVNNGRGPRVEMMVSIPETPHPIDQIILNRRRCVGDPRWRRRRYRVGGDFVRSGRGIDNDRERAAGRLDRLLGHGAA